MGHAPKSSHTRCFTRTLPPPGGPRLARGEVPFFRPAGSDRFVRIRSRKQWDQVRDLLAQGDVEVVVTDGRDPASDRAVRKAAVTLGPRDLADFTIQAPDGSALQLPFLGLYRAGGFPLCRPAHIPEFPALEQELVRATALESGPLTPKRWQDLLAAGLARRAATASRPTHAILVDPQVPLPAAVAAMATQRSRAPQDRTETPTAEDPAPAVDARDSVASVSYTPTGRKLFTQVLAALENPNLQVSDLPEIPARVRSTWRHWTGKSSVADRILDRLEILATWSEGEPKRVLRPPTQSIMVYGPHGIGKTTGLIEATRARGYRILLFSAPVTRPGDLFLQIPKVDVATLESTGLALSLHAELTRGEDPSVPPLVIVVDEFSRIPPQLRSAFMELTGPAHTVAGTEIPNLLGVVCMDNPPWVQVKDETMRYHVDVRQDFAVQTRFCTMRITAEDTGWEEALLRKYGSVGMEEVIQEWARGNHVFLPVMEVISQWHLLHPEEKLRFPPRVLDHFLATMWHSSSPPPAEVAFPLHPHHGRVLPSAKKERAKEIVQTFTSLARTRPTRRGSVALLEDAIKNGWDTHLIGPAGIGKTSLVKEIATKLGFRIELFSAASMSPEDMVLPIPSGDRLEMVVLDRLRAGTKQKPLILVFDELSRTPRTVQGQLLSLMSTRQLAGQKIEHLHAVIGISNPQSDSSGHTYQLGSELDPALASRFVLNLEMGLDEVPYRSYFERRFPKDKDFVDAVLGWFELLDEKDRNRAVTLRQVETLLQFVTQGVTDIQTLREVFPVDLFTGEVDFPGEALLRQRLLQVIRARKQTGADPQAEAVAKGTWGMRDLVMVLTDLEPVLASKTADHAQKAALFAELTEVIDRSFEQSPKDLVEVLSGSKKNLLPTLKKAIPHMPLLRETISKVTAVPVKENRSPEWNKTFNQAKQKFLQIWVKEWSNQQKKDQGN